MRICGQAHRGGAPSASLSSMRPRGQLQVTRKNLYSLLVLLPISSLFCKSKLFHSQKWKISSPCHKRKVIKQINTRKAKQCY